MLLCMTPKSTLLSTQGRYGKGTGQEYLKHFMVEYKMGGGSPWKVYADKNAEQVK